MKLSVTRTHSPEQDPVRPRLVAQMRKGMLVYCVLALLERQPSYGRALVAALRDIPGLATTPGTIYPLLGRLARQRLIAGAFGPTSSSAPRRYYRITDAGRAALDDFAEEWVSLRTGIDLAVRQRSSLAS